MNSTERAPLRVRPATGLGTVARVLPLLALVLSGCVLFARGKRVDDVPREVALHVSNHNSSSVVLYAVNGSLRVRLGTVVTASEADLAVPRNLLVAGTVGLQVHAIAAGRDYLTGPILVRTGQEIELRVENSLTQTSWSVY